MNSVVPVGSTIPDMVNVTIWLPFLRLVLLARSISSLDSSSAAISFTRRRSFFLRFVVRVQSP